MSFKDTVLSDNQKVFINLNEFGERIDLMYDGEYFEQIPAVVLSTHEQIRQNVVGASMRKVSALNRAQGEYLALKVIYVNINDIGGEQPEYGLPIKLRTQDDGEYFDSYFIGNSRVEMEICRISLEKFDE